MDMGAEISFMDESRQTHLVSILRKRSYDVFSANDNEVFRRVSTEFRKIVACKKVRALRKHVNHTGVDWAVDEDVRTHGARDSREARAWGLSDWSGGEKSGGGREFDIPQGMRGAPEDNSGDEDEDDQDEGDGDGVGGEDPMLMEPAKTTGLPTDRYHGLDEKGLCKAAYKDLDQHHTLKADFKRLESALDSDRLAELLGQAISCDDVHDYYSTLKQNKLVIIAAEMIIIPELLSWWNKFNSCEFPADIQTWGQFKQWSGNLPPPHPAGLYFLNG